MPANPTLAARLREITDCDAGCADLLRSAADALDAAARREEAKTKTVKALYTALDGLLMTVIDECGDPDEADECELLDAVRTAQAALDAAKEAQP